MNEQHIIEILDTRPFGEFSGEELSQMRAHSAECGECRNVFQAAQGSAAMLKFEAEQALQPSPFFHTRVMTALREQQEKRGGLKPVWDLRRLWQASKSLVSLLVVMVAALFFAGVLAPGAQGSTEPAALTADTTEAVIFEQDNTLKDITSEQIFQEIYER